jgi:hypothetical protein
MGPGRRDERRERDQDARRAGYADVLRTEGLRSRWQLMVSIVGAIGVINSVPFGVTAGFAVAALIGDELWATSPVGLVSSSSLCRFTSATRKPSGSGRTISTTYSPSRP